MTKEETIQALKKIVEELNALQLEALKHNLIVRVHQPMIFTGESGKPSPVSVHISETY